MTPTRFVANSLVALLGGALIGCGSSSAGAASSADASGPGTRASQGPIGSDGGAPGFSVEEAGSGPPDGADVGESAPDGDSVSESGGPDGAPASGAPE